MSVRHVRTSTHYNHDKILTDAKLILIDYKVDIVANYHNKSFIVRYFNINHKERIERLIKSWAKKLGFRTSWCFQHVDREKTDKQKYETFKNKG